MSALSAARRQLVVATFLGTEGYRPSTARSATTVVPVPPVIAPAPPPPVAPPVAAVVLPPPPPPPPPPLHLPQLQPLQQVQPGAQPGTAVQAGVVAQDEKQLQVATVTETHDDANAEVFAMSALVLFGAATTCQLRRRTAVRAATVRR
jgi:hypothetical protein